jgi:hypothetical protein
MTRADRVPSTPPTNTSALTPTSEARAFYGAECRSYPNCSGGCGLGCTQQHATTNTTRRGFLAQAAVAVAGGAALGMALPLPVSAEAPDVSPAALPVNPALRSAIDDLKSAPS